MPCKKCKKMWEAWDGEKRKWQNGEMKTAVRNHPPLVQMLFSFHFLSRTVPVTPPFSLFQASELEINKYCFTPHSFIVWHKEIRAIECQVKGGVLRVSKHVQGEFMD